jgi:hypothetical protein
LLRKLNFIELLRALTERKELATLIHLLECQQCRKAKLEQNQLLSEEGMDKRIMTAIRTVIECSANSQALQ